MNKINSKINEELNVITANETILENVLSAENVLSSQKQPRLRIKKSLVVAAAVCAALLLTVAASAAIPIFIGFYENWLTENTRLIGEPLDEPKTIFGYDEDGEPLEFVLTHFTYVLQEIDGVSIKSYIDVDDGFTFVFTGADEAIYTDNGAEIIISARKCEGAEFTLILPSAVSAGVVLNNGEGFSFANDEVREELEGLMSKRYSFEIVDEF